MVESNEKLVRDIKVVLTDLEIMLSEIKDKTSIEIAELHSSLLEKLAATKKQLITAEQDILLKEQIGAKMTNEYVHSNAWQFAVIAGVIGFIIGYLT